MAVSHREMPLSLDALNDDILIYIFAALSIPDILTLRQVSRRLSLLSRQYSVWHNACKSEILHDDIPFPRTPLTSLTAKDLERQTLRAYKLGANWRSPNTKLYHVTEVATKSETIEEIKFLTHREQNWIVTISRGIWSDLYLRDCDTLQVVAKWSPGKALFNGMVLNTNHDSDAAIAIAVQRNGVMSVEILSLSHHDQTSGVEIQSVAILDTCHKPIALRGDLVALCDHDSETLILDWKTREQCLLKSPETWKDKALHVIFAQGSIFVVRARSTCVFTEPMMVSQGNDLPITLPYAFASFGWVDGVALALRPSTEFHTTSPFQASLSMLVRTKGDDPWRLEDQFKFLTYNATQNSRSHSTSHHDTPAIDNDTGTFPFTAISSLCSPHQGSLRCSDMVLGSYGTAVWVQPADWAMAGLLSENGYLHYIPAAPSKETLVVAIFPGPLNRGSSEACIKVSFENSGFAWSCLDYDEERGLIALGSNFGGVTMFRL
ncbi:hypothetical protein PAXRUDRAFT_827185 [Paxillus rubicundulus Ve08.2h10]|uniref:F-box domain-containing protein n=1 Tax=Paxillus rubicundulus Ve08.2h10 TaxID=930991 RepID=A0A0D0DDC2_9AGAM|nr:hypothetical protein PAXRUDRAFT_827185 [Paxillus rubicundulus Ve08.2h10]